MELIFNMTKCGKHCDYFLDALYMFYVWLFAALTKLFAEVVTFSSLSKLHRAK